MRCGSTCPKAWSPASPLTRPPSAITLCRPGDRGLRSSNFHLRVVSDSLDTEMPDFNPALNGISHRTSPHWAKGQAFSPDERQAY